MKEVLSLLLVLITLNLTAGNSTCFGRTGNQILDTNHVLVCNPSAETSTCCRLSEICLDNGLCVNATVPKPFSIVGCTDPTLQAPECAAAKACRNNTSPNVAVCGHDQYCCWGEGNCGKGCSATAGELCDCSNVANIFSLPPGNSVTTFPTEKPSTTPSAAYQTSSPSGSNSSNPTSMAKPSTVQTSTYPLSPVNIVGIAVGASLGGFFLLCLIALGIWFCFRAKNGAKTGQPPSGSLNLKAANIDGQNSSPDSEQVYGGSELYGQDSGHELGAQPRFELHSEYRSVQELEGDEKSKRRVAELPGRGSGG